MSDFGGTYLGHIAVRKFGVDAHGTYRASTIKQLAWLDDITTAIESYTDSQDAQQASITWHSLASSVTELNLYSVGSNGTQDYTWTSEGWNNDPHTGLLVSSYVGGRYIILNGNVLLVNAKIIFPSSSAIDRFWSYNSAVDITLGKLGYSVVSSVTQVTYAENKNINSRFIGTLIGDKIRITQTGQDFDFDGNTVHFSFMASV
jgi:hypothetical protein